tara:strand:+ start:778 stop:1311 length:534 start_codon:yes stop_codon:yes gene_type:complete
MDGYKRTLIRRLKFKSREVGEELSNCKEIYEKAFHLFYSAVLEYCDSNNIKDPFSNSPSPKSEEKKTSLTSDFKKIFRQIATRTHTDVTKDEASRPLLDKAVKAKKENKSNDLMTLAHDLKIDVSNIDYKSIGHLEKSIEEAKSEIDTMHSSYPWVWFYSDDVKKKSIIKVFASRKV